MLSRLRTQNLLTQRRWLVFLATVFWPLVAVAALLVRSGTPGFQQDWDWPIDRSQIFYFTTFDLHAWLPSGAGQPMIYPQPWWPNLLAGFFCYVFGVHFGLIVTLFFWLIVAASGIRAAIKTVVSSPYAQIAATALYTVTPVTLNEIQAGHLYFLAGYAILPWIVAVTMKPASFASGVILGTLIGLSGCQQQFLLLSGFLAALYLMSSNRRAWPMLVIAIPIALAVSSPEWIIALLLHRDITSLGIYASMPHWVNAQSAPVSERLRMLGYIGGYDHRLLSSFVQTLLWGIPGLSFIALLSSLPAPRLRNFALASSISLMLGVILSSGTYGPLASFFLHTFAKCYPCSLFRELYDFSPLTALGYASLIPLVLSNPGAPLARAVAAGTAFYSIVLGLFIAEAATKDIPLIHSHQLRPPAASLLVGYRILALPAIFPQRVDSYPAQGYSPALLGFGNHPSADATLALFPDAYASRLVLHGFTTNLMPLLSRMGIGSVYSIPDLRGITIAAAMGAEPALRPLIPSATQLPVPFVEIPSGSRIRVEPFSAEPGTLASSYIGSRNLSPFRQARYIDPNIIATSTDPRHGWARTAFWPLLPAWIYAVPPGIFSLENRAPLPSPSAMIVAGSQDGHIYSTGCTNVRHLDGHWSILRCDKNPILYGKPPLAISLIAENARISQIHHLTGAIGDATILSESPDRLTVRIRAKPGSVLVLREQFSSDWVISIPGTYHVPVDGNMNGWLLPHGFDGIITVYFWPSLYHDVAVAISATLVFATFLYTLSYRFTGNAIRKQRRSPSHEN